jgi:DNA-directed RNA polymerase beta subunit
MQQNIEPEEELPKGVILRDFDDFTTLRNQIFDGVKNSMIKSFPVNYGSVRMELHDVDYDDRDDVPVSEQKKNLLENKYITKKLRGTIKLFDTTNDQLLEEKRISLMKVPYLTNRGTFIHGGNEYASIMQSRLLPGVYTRRQANGELETQFNVKPGTGIGFRVGFEPETTQYRVKISQANLHLYSLLKDLGTSDKELEKAWGPEIFRANQMKYDARVFDKAYDRLVSGRQKKLDKTREDKIASVRNALEAAQIHARVAQKNLPNMFDPKIASQWEAQWQGKQAAEKVIDEMPFNPDLEPEQVYENYFDEDEGVKSAADMQALMQARRHSSQAKEEYKKKTAIMAAALARYPEEFIVDQNGRMSGITHLPTGFRIHVPKEIIPQGVKRVFQEDEEDVETNKEAAWQNVPKKVLDAILTGNKDLLQQLGRRGGQVAAKVKANKKLMMQKQMDEHLQHPDVQHFLSILEKDASTNEDFIPDYSPEDIQDAYNAIYGHYGPRLASMDKWPEEWIKSDVDPMGWLQWYEQYKSGRRTEDDERQIKRWKSFKARHGSQFKKNPTPRRAFALRNWAIDPLKLIEDEEVRGQLAQAMESYKQQAWDKYNKEK